MKLKINPIVHTERLLLREIRSSDKDALIAILTNKEVGKTYMLPESPSPEEQLKMFERFQALSASEERFVYGIFLEERLIGFLNDVAVTETEIELGYVIHPHYKNQGFATEALKAAMAQLFAIGFSVVKAGAFEGNVPSMRVMEKAGMVRSGEEEIIAYRGKDLRCFYYQKENDSMGR